MALTVAWCIGWLTPSAGAVDNVAWLDALQTIRANDLQNHVNVLADDAMEGREAGSRGGHAAAEYLARHFREAGLRAAGEEGGYFQEFGHACRNILGMLEGADPELRREFVLLGAHYDHVGHGSRRTSFGPVGPIHNGADDNASGVSGVLEVIDAMKSLPAPPRRSVLFALWDGEELGLLGSRHYVAHPTVPLDKIVLNVHLDMIGRMRDERLMVYGSRTASGLRRFLAESNHEPRLLLDFDWELKSNSDHYPFVEHNVPTLLFHTGLNEDTHRPTDDAERINADGMQQSARLAFGAVYEAATRMTGFSFRAAARQEYPADRKRMERALPPAPPRLGIRWRKDAAAPGLLVESVDPGSAAQRSGLLPGDRLLSFAGQTVNDGDRLRRAVLAASSPAPVSVQRAGQREPLSLQLELDGSPTRLGISWCEDDAEPGTILVTRVIAGSPADAAQLRAGDRVYAVAKQVFANSDEFADLATSLASPLTLTVERQGRVEHVTLDVPPPAPPQRL